ncbi:MAG: DUF488 domain-containing protein [Opitutaceae bacterium]
MSINIYRYGERKGLAGLCIGVARHLPRGVRRADYVRKGYFDVWLPTLAPSPEIVAAYRHGKITLRVFSARYHREMRRPDARHAIALLAAVSRNQPIHLGCYCEDPERCHRTLLAKLVERAVTETGAARAARGTTGASHSGFASPACSMPEIAD